MNSVVDTGGSLHELFRDERDAIVMLGLLSHVYQHWDPPVPAIPPHHFPTHNIGLNIHAAVIDNVDGEALAVERNLIHQECSPFAHAEQKAIRAAITRLHAKQPRRADETVEEYYLNRLFYGPGIRPEDYLSVGCTIYTTLEPCPMCTTTICVCRMKRTVYLFEDGTFGGSWDWRLSPTHQGIKTQYYQHSDMQYGQPVLLTPSPLVSKVKSAYRDLTSKASELSVAGIFETLFLDHLYAELAQIYASFVNLSPGDLVTEGLHRCANLKTMKDFKQMCGIPFTEV